MAEAKLENMIVLTGEQAAPNLLSARYFNPKRIFILHTRFHKSKYMAENLAECMKEIQCCLVEIDDFDVGKIRSQVLALLAGRSDTMVNITGGTKLMSIGALDAARIANAQVLYVRSQGGKTEVDLLGFKEDGATYRCETFPLIGNISIDDYLMAYFGDTYHFGAFATGSGRAFELALNDVLKVIVDEVRPAWEHNSKSLNVDFIIRCSNQIGIIEAKTGKKAQTMDGIKQLATAGGQRFFGTYVQRFLVIDQELRKDNENNRELAEAIGIKLVELPSFSTSGSISAEDQANLAEAIHNAMGKPLKFEGMKKP